MLSFVSFIMKEMNGMAGNVSVDSQSIRDGIKVCEYAINQLEQASQALKKQYQDAGSSGWRDSKYNDLGILIDQCDSALKKPRQELDDSLVKLKQLLTEVEHYESINII